MTLRAAQQRYDNMQPDESDMPDEHSYSGVISLDDDGYDFCFDSGTITGFARYDEESDSWVEGEMPDYNGGDTLLDKAHDAAHFMWSVECQAVRNDF